MIAGLVRWFAYIAALLLSQTVVAAEQIYTLEFLHTNDRNKARDQALIVSGVVKLPCRIITSAGTFYLRCGKAGEFTPLKAELERLKTLGIDSAQLVQVADDTNEIIHSYQPIDVGPEAQENLLAIARQKLSFAHQTEPDAKKEPDILAEARKLREMDEGNTLLGQGWLAYENADLKTAIEIFSSASEIDSVKMPATFGLALSYFNDQQHQKALQPLRILLEEDYEPDTVLPLYLQAAMSTGNLDIVKDYYQKLPIDQQQQWQQKLEMLAMEKTFADIGKRPTRAKFKKFIADNQKYLNVCLPVNVWDTLAKRLVAYKDNQQALSLYRQMWKSCPDEGIRVGILYQLNKLRPFKHQQPLLAEELAKDIGKDYRRQLNDYNYNSLMAEAGKLPPGSDEAGAIFAQIHRPYNVYTRYKLAKSWWHYQREDYKSAMADFSWLWHNRENREALKGMLFSMMRLGQIDNALAIVDRHEVPEMKAMLQKEKLSTLDANSAQAYELAHDILRQQPEYVPALSTLGWNAIAAEQWGLATAYFKRWQELEPDNQGPLTGLMQSYSKQQMFDDAFALAKRLDKPDEFNWQYNVQFEKGLSLFNQKDYQKAEAIFADLLRLRPQERGLQTLYTWSLFHQEKYKKSAKSFLTLYKDKDDSDVAQGYLSSLDKLGKARKKHKFVDDLAQSENFDNRVLAAGQYTEQKNFLRAAFADPSSDKYYTGVNNTEFWVDYNYHHKNGVHGVSAFDVKEMQFGMSFVWEPASRLYLTVNYEEVDANLRSVSPFLGNDFTFGNIPPEFAGADLTAVSTKDTIWYPFVRYRREDRWDLDMGVGLSPVNGPLDSKLVWFFAAEQGSNHLTLYRRPMFDAQLNYIGLKDPYSTKKWGRVLETGVKYTHTGMLSEDYWITGSGEYNRYAGSNIITNQSAKTSVMVGTDFPAEAMEVSGGVSLNASGYQRNSIFYSFGHGGYFSPQLLWQAGLFSHFESKKHVVDWWELDLSVGYFQFRTDPQERYPFGLFKQMDPGGKGSGISYMVRGEKHWRLTEQFELGIAGEVIRSPGYERWRAGLIFRYFWKRHNYLISKHHVMRPWAR